MLYQILALLIWSSSFVSAKYAYAMLDPALLVQLRLTIAALIVLPTALKYAPKIPKRAWKKLVLLAFLHHTVVLMLHFTGLNLTSAASAITLLGLEPLLMVFFGHFFFHDRAQWFHWLFGAMAFVGVMLLVVGGHANGGQANLWGSVLILLGCMVFCAIWRPTKRMIGIIGAPAYTSLSLLLGALTCLPFSLLLTQNFHIAWSWQGSASVLYLGVACSWLAYLLWNKGTMFVSANLSGVLISLEPAFGVLLAVLLLGEHLTTVSWFGVALIMIATILAGILPQYLNKEIKH